jgi:ATP:corrinoid adenosyltransferase
MKGKPENVELVLTGRWAKPEVLRLADLVTEMKESTTTGKESTVESGLNAERRGRRRDNAFLVFFEFLPDPW